MGLSNQRDQNGGLLRSQQGGPGRSHRSGRKRARLAAGPFAAQRDAPVHRPFFSGRLPALLKHLPWLLALGLSPLFRGALHGDGQVLVGLLLAVSLALACAELGRANIPTAPRVLAWLGAALLILPLLPLPAGLLHLLSPARLELATAFPVEPGAPAGIVPLTLSSSRTIQRLWELALVFTGFWLARNAARHAEMARAFAGTLAAAVLLLAAAEFWHLGSGRTIWQSPWPTAAGTYANRSHFSNWICVAALPCIGWCIRCWRPMVAARAAGVTAPGAAPVERVFFLVAVVLGLMAAVLSGSRGGIAAWIIGTASILVLLGRRSRDPSRWTGLVFAGVGLAAVLIACGGVVLDRVVTQAQPLGLKLRVWAESLRVVGAFPLLGTGWGAFSTAFNLSKSFLGDTTVEHAESDYIQLLVETGLIGALVFGGLLVGFGGRLAVRVWREKFAEPELVFGVFAGLVVFFAHASVEFVFQVPANALLAGCLAGFLAGACDRARLPVLLPPLPRWRIGLNLAGALALGIVAVRHGAGWLAWEQARVSGEPATQARQLERAVRLWPWASERSIALARARLREAAPAPGPARATTLGRVRRELTDAARRDPFNWELRLERAWVELESGADLAHARREVWAAVRLNPLQPQIPLEFARALAQTDPDFALELLNAAPLSRRPDFWGAFELAWSIRPQPAMLWGLTPDSIDGLMALGDFAVGKRLFAMAAQAYERLEGRANPLTLAEKYLLVRLPGRALALLEHARDSDRVRLVRARAHREAGDHAAAIRELEQLFGIYRHLPRLTKLLALPGSLAVLGARSGEPTPTDAFALAESICRRPAPERDLALLSRLAEAHPEEPRLLWLVFQTQLDLHDFEAASGTGVELAARLTVQE